MNYYLDTEFIEGPQKTRYWTNPMVITGVSIYLIGVLCILMFGQILWAQLIAFSGAIIWFFQGSYTKATKPTIDLISIGIVAEDGREGYWISKDFNLKEAWNRYDLKPNKLYPTGPLMIKDYWIRENVLRPIFNEWVRKDHHWTNKHRTLGNWKFTYKNFKYHLKRQGKSNEQIAEEVKEFVDPKMVRIHQWVNRIDLSQKEEDIPLSNPQFYGYYADYDHVALCWLFGRMIDLPKGFPMYTRDLKQMLDEKAESIRENRIDGLLGEVEIREGERVYVEKKITDFLDYPKQTNEHNALSDARWNKKLHEFIQKL